MNAFTVIFTDGTHYTTSANGTLKSFTDYMMQFGGIITDEDQATGKETHRKIERIDPARINGYNIKFNDFWGYWQVSHVEIGACIAEFKTAQEAADYCEKG